MKWLLLLLFSVPYNFFLPSFSVKLQNETSCDKLKKKISAVLLRYNTLYIKLNRGKKCVVCGWMWNKNEKKCTEANSMQHMENIK